jgi:hypothetical protein
LRVQFLLPFCWPCFFLRFQAYDASHPADIALVSLGADPQWAQLEAALNKVNDEISRQGAIDRVAAPSLCVYMIAFSSS